MLILSLCLAVKLRTGEAGPFEIKDERSFKDYVKKVAAQLGTEVTRVKVKGTKVVDGIPYTGVFSLRRNPSTGELGMGMDHGAGGLASLPDCGYLIDSMRQHLGMDMGMITLLCSIQGFSGRVFRVRRETGEMPLEEGNSGAGAKDVLVFLVTVGKQPGFQAAVETAQTIAKVTKAEVKNVIIEGTIVRRKRQKR